MSKSRVTIVNKYTEGATGLGATEQLIPLSTPQAVGINDLFNITDITMTAAAGFQIWLSTTPNAAGNFYSMIFPAAGTLNQSLESPIQIAGGIAGANVYSLHSGNANVASIQFNGELHETS